MRRLLLTLAFALAAHHAPAESFCVTQEQLVFACSGEPLNAFVEPPRRSDREVVTHPCLAAGPGWPP